MQAGLRQSRLQLEQYARTLEQRVSERTAELERANTALSRRAVQLEASSQVGQQITSVLNLDQLLMLVVDLIQDRFGYYFVGVWLLADAQDFVVLRAGTGQAGQLLRERGFRIPLDTASIVASVCRTGAYRAVDDVSEDAEYLALEELSDTRSELALPLRKGEAVLGVLDIESDRRAAFGPDDRIVLQTLADQIAIAIHNAQLYKSEQHRRQLAESLEQIGRTLSSSLDMRKVPDRILEQLAIVVPYERGSVMLQQGDKVHIIAHRGFPDDERVRNLHVSIRQGDVFQQMANSHRPLLVDDVTQEPGWQQVEWLPLQRSFLGVPLISQDRVIGMISLLRRETAAFSPHDATLVLAFAGQAAIALENARLYDEISRFSQQLEEKVRERTAALQVAYDQLERLDRTKSDFIGIASHELRTPLTVLRGYSQMLLSDPQIRASSYYQQLIAGIHSGAIRMQSVVESMLDVAKIDSRALQLLPEPLFVPALIHQIVYEQLVEPLAERQLELVVQDMSRLPAIEADPEALHKVFYHLITNAIKYTPDGGTITISGHPLAVDQDKLPEGGIEVIVSDTGIGIDPEFQELIFTKFYQTGEIALHSTGKTKFKGGGPGLGLAIARGIIEAHGGALWVESRGCDEETCPGSHFHVVLPIHRRARYKQQDPEA
jgi:signal transduction histidine kinase